MAPGGGIVSRGSAGAAAVRLIGGAAILLACATTPVLAQEAGDGGWPIRLSVIGGVDGVSPEAHVFGGVGAGWTPGSGTGVEGLGATGLVLGGTGAGYGSFLAGAGPSIRVAGAPGSGELRLWGGAGWYRESRSLPGSGFGTGASAGAGAGNAVAPSVARRAAPVALAGLQGRRPVGPVALEVGVTGWIGRFEEAGFQTPARFETLRLHVGVSR